MNEGVDEEVDGRDEERVEVAQDQKGLFGVRQEVERRNLGQSHRSEVHYLVKEAKMAVATFSSSLF